MCVMRLICGNVSTRGEEDESGRTDAKLLGFVSIMLVPGTG